MPEHAIRDHQRRIARPTSRREPARGRPPGRALRVGLLALLAAAGSAGAAPDPRLDPALLELRDQLASLLAGSLPERTSVAQLFSVPPDDLEAVRRRVAELEGEIALLETRRRATEPDGAPPADDPTSAGDVAAAELATLRLEIARSRLAYLRRLRVLLERMPESSRGALRGFGAPRAALRDHARGVARAGVAIGALGGRLRVLGRRVSGGALVGFRTEARELAANLTGLSASLAQRAEHHAAAAQELETTAAALEAEGRALRRSLLLAAASPEPSASLDALFLERVREQRTVRKASERLRARSFEEDVARLEREAGELAATPERLGTLREAQEVADAAAALLESSDASLDGVRASLALWRLAFVNEAVIALAPIASGTARQEAYAFSSEIVDDVRAELGSAWERARGLARIRGRQLADLPAQLGTPAGLRGTARALGVAALVAAWLLARRFNSRIVVATVKRLTALGVLGRRVGSAVRWAGLVQAVLPVLLSYPALLLTLRLLGREAPEARLLEAAFLPVFLYLLGARALDGATRRITTGRPALVALAPSDVVRLRRTYLRLGIVIASAALIDRVTGATVGVGRLASAVNALALAWVAVWAALEAVGWRAALARAWTDLLGTEGSAGTEGRLVAWMGRSRAGFLLSPVALLRVTTHHGWRRLARTAWMTELGQRLRARSLRRLVRSSDDDAGPPGSALPEAYLREFPLYPILGDEGTVLLPRDESLAQILSQVGRWRADRSEGSLVLHGEKGLGKTTLAGLVARGVEDLEVVQITLRGKPVTEEQLIAALVPELPGADGGDIGALARSLAEGDERIVLLDEAHNVFLRTVAGYRAYDALVDLVNATSERVFWLLVFNSFTWRFLNESRGRMHYFRRVQGVPRWSHDEIQELIRRRNDRSGFSLEFDELLLSDDAAHTGGLELIEGAESYFRLLAEASSGNPRVATRLWLSSLSPVAEDRLRVGLFRETPREVVDELGDELLFALAAICQHENLDSAELARVLNAPPSFARFAIRFLLEQGLVERKDESSDRATLAPTAYGQVVRSLREKHLLLE